MAKVTEIALAQDKGYVTPEEAGKLVRAELGLPETQEEATATVEGEQVDAQTAA